MRMLVRYRTVDYDDSQDLDVVRKRYMHTLLVCTSLVTCRRQNVFSHSSGTMFAHWSHALWLTDVR
jgi:hypothetical protein